MDFDNITIEICDDLPDRTVLDDMLADYYEPFVALMRGLGAPVSREELQSAQDEFWTNAADYMPPRGAVAMARNELGQLIGLCNLKRLDAQSGELKRLYVKNEFRRKGLGSELLTALVSQASELGIARLIAEILNPDLGGMLITLGFEKCSSPLETTTSKNYPILRPHLQTFVKKLTET